MNMNMDMDILKFRTFLGSALYDIYNLGESLKSCTDDPETLVALFAFVSIHVSSVSKP